ARKYAACSCRIIIKTYPGCSSILGRYIEEHTHALGETNARFCQIPQETWDDIENLIRAGTKLDAVLEQVNENSSHPRNKFISRADVRRMEKLVEEENIRLGKKDGESVLAWARRLESEGSLLAFKASNAPPPPGSSVNETAFIFIIQTKYMREKWNEWGNDFAGLDATHNTS
ncbi:hypothetical protein GGU10DRAFT_243477, partial [Lentinula aff. detonsa]